MAALNMYTICKELLVTQDFVNMKKYMGITMMLVNS